MQIHLIGTDLPGRDCGPGEDFPGFTNIHVAVQRKNRPADLLDLQPADADTVQWTLECTVDGVDVRGPYIQGSPGRRFIYLSWGSVEDGQFTMFRRAKLMMGDVPFETLQAATKSGSLTGRLGLTDTKGHPLCARVTPPQISWTA